MTLNYLEDVSISEEWECCWVHTWEPSPPLLLDRGGSPCRCSEESIKFKSKDIERQHVTHTTQQPHILQCFFSSFWKGNKITERWQLLFNLPDRCRWLKAPETKEMKNLSLVHTERELDRLAQTVQNWTYWQSLNKSSQLIHFWPKCIELYTVR